MNTLNQDWIEKLPIKNIRQIEQVAGGDINLAYQIQTPDKFYFMKVQPNHHASYFDHEKLGLETIGKVVSVPMPVASGQIDGDAYLILPWLDQSSGNQYELGRMVAKMHQAYSPNKQFGFALSHDTKVLKKNNSWNKSWVDFYINQRLLPEIEAAKKAGRWNDFRQKHFQNMLKEFKEYYQDKEVKPSLLHGDLWAGNFMFSQHKPFLIDPDALYGDREFDIALTTVFGGFSPDFYAGYNSVYPLGNGVDHRLLWYKFYYICMHLLLFGESYGPSLDNILDQF